MKKTVNSLLIASFLLSGCAAKSENIAASYVSPMQYSSYNCNQIRMELQRVSRRVNEVAGKQDGERSKDSVALGVGLVLFWPALFFMMGDDQKEELARLKGEYEALESAAIQKECNVADEIREAQAMQEERQRAQTEEQEKSGLND